MAKLSTDAARRAAISPYAADPALSDVVKAQSQFAKNGWASYGTIGHRDLWRSPVAGADAAVMWDCGDYSKAGRMVAATGQKLTVGVPRSTTKISFVRVGVTWKVQSIAYLEHEKC